MSLGDLWSGSGIAARVIVTVLAAFAAFLAYVILERAVASRGASTRPARLRRHMHALAAIKTTAPLLGFLGTLIGLINGLAGIALTGQLDPRTVSAGIAEALVLTVAGLLVGLPAWWAHAWITARGERQTAA